MKVKLSTLRRLIRESCGAVEPIEIPLDHSVIDPIGRDLDYETPLEGKHAKNHLFHAGEDAKKLHDLLQDEDNIPAWCSDYISLARHGLGTVHDYLSYKISKK